MTAVTDTAPDRAAARRCCAGSRARRCERGCAGERARAGCRSAVRAGGLLLLGWAVVRELRLPPEERRWHGRLAGFVPYDLRPPTPARLRERMWAPAGPLLSPQVVGVGWTVNLGRLLALARRFLAAVQRCRGKGVSSPVSGLSAVPDPDADAIALH